MVITGDASFLAGTPSATPEQCVRFILARPHGEYTEVDIARSIVPAYFEACAAVGADPVVLIAQMIHETGTLTSWWSQRPRRNPAGIGVTGQKRPEQPSTGAWQFHDQESHWREGVAFPTWKDDSIPAHIGRMLAYALRDDQASSTQRALIVRAMSYRPLPAKFRGAAPTLRGLAGRWAVPGTDYPDKIARIASAIQAL
ncbi:MAG TPA: glucosaminidase domain-containing protein [Roseiflexaceae bacterium]|nr:glucosaminidase domain-containing protein [Roseiflexaceae bacterium]